jgi:hypothetical protein
MWQDASMIWYRPQYYVGELYKSDTLLQVVGHTSVEMITREGNLISCDVFSTDRDNKADNGHFAESDTGTSYSL